MTGQLVAAGLAAGLIVTGTATRGFGLAPSVAKTAASSLQPPASVTPRDVVPSFEPNLGQWGDGIAFVARGKGWRSQVSAARNRMVVTDGRTSAAVTVNIEGGSPTARPEPFGLERAFSAYFFGRDPARWQHHVPRYQGVRFHEVYPGVDLVYHTRGEHVEYDFEVRPGADPAQIGLRVDGADALTMAANGDLLMHTGAGELRQHRPEVYQMKDGARVAVAARQRLDGGLVRLDLGDYDHARPLVVDPVLEWSTLLGGSTSTGSWPADETLHAVAAGENGAFFVAGQSRSTDFPVVEPFDPGVSPSDYTEGVVSKFMPDLQSGIPVLVWSSYFGGSGGDGADALSVGKAGAVYLAGSTYSHDFPVLHSLQPFNISGSLFEAFAMRLQDNGVSVDMVWSSYLGGSSDDNGRAIAIDDRTGSVYVAGDTQSTDFPSVAALQTDQPGRDVFVAKFNPFAGTALTLAYSTYLGGADADRLAAMVVDTAGAAYVVGSTDSANFPLVSALGPRGSRSQGFVAKVAAAHSPTASLEWSTLLGDGVRGVALDATGVVVVGGTYLNAVAAVNAHPDLVAAGGTDFVARLTATTPLALAWAGPIGYQTYGNAVAVDRVGAVYVAGIGDTPSTRNAYVARFRLDPNHLLTKQWEATLGGSSPDGAEAIALDREASIYVAGSTRSDDFPLINPADSTQIEGEGFVARLRNDDVTIALASQPVGVPIVVAGPAGCRPGAYVTSHAHAVVPVPSTPCVVTYPATRLTTPGTRLKFTDWTDPLQPVVPTLTFAAPSFPDGPLSFTARYRTQHQLTTRVTPAGAGAISPASGAFFDEGTTRTVVATPAACFAFSAWSPNVVTDAVAMTAPQLVSATFRPDGASVLTTAAIQLGPMQRVSVGRFRQLVTVRNSLAGVTRPALVFTGLTSGFTVVNAAGVTSCTSSGQRYVFIPQPFGTQALTVEFVKTGALLAPTYGPVVVVNGQP